MIGIDQPFDSQLLMKVVGKVKYLFVGSKKFDEEKPEIRESFNDCLVQFLEADQPEFTDIQM